MLTVFKNQILVEDFKKGKITQNYLNHLLIFWGDRTISIGDCILTNEQKQTLLQQCYEKLQWSYQ